MVRAFQASHIYQIYAPPFLLPCYSSSYTYLVVAHAFDGARVVQVPKVLKEIGELYPGPWERDVEYQW